VIYASPFRHAVLDGFVDPETVSAINREWPTQWVRKDSDTSVKWFNNELSELVESVISEIDIGLVEEVTGIPDLFPDPLLYGAGLHCIPPGGFLKMHVDFNAHPEGWHRRANMLIYLNERWEDDWGGHLQLGLESTKLIAPIGGRCVIFETNDQSWHGHPHPLTCPADVQRRSLALYFYTEAPPTEPAHTTIYV